MKYEKPPLSIQEQSKQLCDRGLIIEDKGFAESVLSSINYYRLSAYYFPFQKDKEQHLFYPDKRFEDIVHLYEFDSALRVLIFRLVESAEILARMRITYCLVTKYNDPFCYVDKKLYSPKFLGKQLAIEDLEKQCRNFPNIDVRWLWDQLKEKNYIDKKGEIIKKFSTFDDFQLGNISNEVQKAIFKCFSVSPFQEWIEQMDSTLLESRETFVMHFRKKYENPYLPLWMVTETISFGQLSKLYAGLNGDNKEQIAKLYDLPHKLLGQWLHSLTYLRNICAHHNRLWNRILEIRPRKPRHLKDKDVWNNKIFSLLLVLKRMVAETFDWEKFIKELNDLFKENEFVDVNNMGFSDDWERWLSK